MIPVDRDGKPNPWAEAVARGEVPGVAAPDRPTLRSVSATSRGPARARGNGTPPRAAGFSPSLGAAAPGTTPDRPPAAVEFFVAGRPTPQGSKRAIQHKHTKRPVVIEQAGANLATWREAIRAQTAIAMRGRAALSGPVSVSLVFYLARPLTHYRSAAGTRFLRPDAPVWHTGRPDTDKLTRAVLDALTTSTARGVLVPGAYADDSLVCDLAASKLYADNGHTGARIRITEMEF